jgi:hypothetical protein
MHIAIDVNHKLEEGENFTHDNAHEIAFGVARYLHEKGHDVDKITLTHGGLKGGSHIFNLATINSTQEA